MTNLVVNPVNNSEDVKVSENLDFFDTYSRADATDQDSEILSFSLGNLSNLLQRIHKGRLGDASAFPEITHIYNVSHANCMDGKASMLVMYYFSCILGYNSFNKDITRIERYLNYSERGGLSDLVNLSETDNISVVDSYLLKLFPELADIGFEYNPGVVFIFADFSLPLAALQRLALSFTVIVTDHHANPQAAVLSCLCNPNFFHEIHTLNRPSRYTNLFVRYDKNESGATCLFLAVQEALRRLPKRVYGAFLNTPVKHLRMGDAVAFFYSPVESIPFLAYTRDHDLWKFELPFSREVRAFYSAVDFKDTESLVTHCSKVTDHNSIKDIADKGSFCLEQINRAVKKAVESSALVNICGFSVYAVFASQHISEIGNALAQIPENTSKIGAVFQMIRNDKTPVVVSLRSIYPVDCSAIARTLGGGGHAQASGASLTLEKFVQFMYSYFTPDYKYE